MTDADTVRQALDHLYHAGEAPTEWLTTGLDALDRLEKERNGLQHVIDCADTPLMRDVLAERDRLREALEQIEAIQPKVLGYIRDNGFVFDGIGTEPGNWQHLAFSIYSDLCEADAIARGALGRHQ